MKHIQKVKSKLHPLRIWYNKYIKIPWLYHQTNKLQILNTIDTLQYILNHRCSVSRYGDGEFDVMTGGAGFFQKFHPILSKRLQEVLESNLPGHMIAIPLPLKDISSFRPAIPYNFWQLYVAGHWKSIKPYLRFDKLYLDTQFTRFYYERADRSFCAQYVNSLKAIWQDRDIIIVEGANTRSGIGNDLYDNARSVRRILCPSLNAFDKYDDILNNVTQIADKENIILISLGMTATVLAYDLAKLNLWALDLGHLDIEYEWFKMGATEKTAIKGKYVNECPDGHDFSSYNSPIYMSQIICDLSKR